ncbi:MAG TPA: choice-of-anchor Q domain-containing protein [Pyrinomonadaceae bacterium]|nr:choice-of-anchor Q domain-containing protein [Pyrinomonadaceae bacterium]
MIPKALACFTLLLLFTTASFALTYTVTKVADTNDGACDADCSLREAVAAANATVDNDVVAFSSLFDTSQTIVLSGSEIVVANNGTLTINGPGAHLLTIDGNQASRILSSGANVVVNINAIRFTRGNGAGAVNTGRGGAIYNVGGTMVISNSVITGNTAANGGALNNAASASPSVPANLTLINCVLSNNSTTSSGAALQNFSTSTLHMRGTTVSGNTTSSTGIAGAFQANGTVTITNSTFSGNSAPAGTGAGVYYNGTSLIMTNATIVNNTSSVGSGGLHRTGTNPTAIVRNSIFANNSTADAFGLMSSQGNNIIGNVGTSTGWVASDLQNTNPMLGSLADNGGPTQTHLPLADSPAINAGQNCVVDLSCSANNPPVAVTTDQRGVARPSGGTVDMGSVEVVAIVNVSVSGRVFSSVGSYVPRAIVTISNKGGVISSDTTSSFGNFTLTGVPSGQTYTVNVIAKGYQFTPVVVPVSGEVTNLEITATSSPFGPVRKE